MAEVAERLALTLKQMRRMRGLTQHRLALLSGVPRPTIANLESGSANPTLHVLTRVAAALQVSLEELVAAPPPMARFYEADQLASELRGEVLIRQLLPDAIPGVVMERMWLPKGSAVTGVPHQPGTREYLTCEVGRLRLEASGEIHKLEPGDVVVFRGDQEHRYANIARRRTVAYALVMPS